MKGSNGAFEPDAVSGNDHDCGADGGIPDGEGLSENSHGNFVTTDNFDGFELFEEIGKGGRLLDTARAICRTRPEAPFDARMVGCEHAAS